MLLLTLRKSTFLRSFCSWYLSFLTMMIVVFSGVSKRWSLMTVHVGRNLSLNADHDVRLSSPTGSSLLSSVTLVRKFAPLFCKLVLLTFFQALSISVGSTFASDQPDFQTAKSVTVLEKRAIGLTSTARLVYYTDCSSGFASVHARRYPWQAVTLNDNRHSVPVLLTANILTSSHTICTLSSRRPPYYWHLSYEPTPRYAAATAWNAQPTIYGWEPPVRSSTPSHEHGTERPSQSCPLRERTAKYAVTHDGPQIPQHAHTSTRRCHRRHPPTTAAGAATLHAWTTQPPTWEYVRLPHGPASTFISI